MAEILELPFMEFVCILSPINSVLKGVAAFSFQMNSLTYFR